jgi:hypothetical protein
MKPSHLSAIAAVACAVSATTSCSARNYEQAYFSPQRSGYLVELSGKRHRLVHDPVSLIVGTSYDETHELELPRLQGTIEGREIKHFKYGGTIVISDNRMTVALTCGDAGENSSWNGTYVLSPKVEPSQREIAAVRSKMFRGDKSEAVFAARKLMDMGRDGRRTVYDALLNDPGVRNKIVYDLSSLHISRPEKVERWVPDDGPDLEKLAQNGDPEIMYVGMSFLSCTDDGRKRLREIARRDPTRQGPADWYLARERR